MGQGMAYKRSNGKLQRRKPTPAQMTLSFISQPGASWLDLNLAASIANRRGYKQQGSDWVVAGFTLYTGTTGAMSIWKAPDTWVVDNAYTKAMALHKEMQEQVLADEPDIQGKWHDFKVYLDSNMTAETIQCAADPTGRILTPVTEQFGTGLIQVPAVGQTDSLTTADFTGAAAPKADWSWSKLQIPNDPASGTTAEYVMHLIGPDTPTSKGLVAGYALSRSRPNDNEPNVPRVEGWMNELFDVGENNEEIRDDIVADNDQPPYALFPGSSTSEAYPGGSTEQTGLHLHSASSVTGTTVGGITNIRGGNFKCGLMKLFNVGLTDCIVQVHLVPGNNRGYLC